MANSRMIVPALLALVLGASWSFGARYDKQGKVCCLTKGESYTAPIKGLVCSGCAENIRQALLKLKGVEDASLDAEKGVLTVKAKDTVKIKAIQKALKAASAKMGMGAKYEIGELQPIVSKAQGQDSTTSTSLKTVTCRLKGMTCAGCAAMIEGALTKTKGIKTASVSFKEERAVVEVDPAQAGEKDVLAAIEKAGFKAEVEQ